MTAYAAAAGLEIAPQEGLSRVSAPGPGSVWMDSPMIDLLRSADGRTLEEVLHSGEAEKHSDRAMRAALACLATAGFLRRVGAPPPVPETPGPVTGPPVSVIIVGFNSREWLAECLPSLAAQTYSPLECIVVDNGSGDGSGPWLREHFPAVRYVFLPASRPLAGAINQGVSLAGGAFLFLLNPDVRLQPEAVAHLVAVAREDDRCAAVAAKLRMASAPAFLNGLGNYVGAFSWGTDWGIGHLDLGQFDGQEEVPSVCFAAALISRRAWEAVGPLDEGFPLYYEDSEWSYRARLFGWRLRAAPRAVIRHAMGVRPGGPRETGLPPWKLQAVVYGRARFALKLLERERFRFLRNYGLDDGAHVLGALLRGRWPAVRAYGAAWRRTLRDLPQIRKARREVRRRRTLSDQELFSRQRNAPRNLVKNGLPLLTWDIVETEYAPLLFAENQRMDPEIAGRKPRLLIISHDRVDTHMAGPGIRYLEMARALSRLGLEVTLAVPEHTGLDEAGLRLVPYDPHQVKPMKRLVEAAEVTLISGFLIRRFPFLEKTASRLVADFYDPMVLENLHYYMEEPLGSREDLNARTVQITNTLARTADFFICGNERQRDYWIGLLTANRRVNPRTFAADNSLRGLIDVVGIGLPDREPRHHPLVRGRHPAVSPEARLVLWGGGLWNWLDPLTLVSAWPAVLKAHPEARLIFPGTRHPNPHVPAHAMVEKTRQLAGELGEKDRTILFFEWLSYEDREALLCEADVGAALHPVHLETRYAIRTRVMDYLWARLPILITEGDVTSEWVRQEDLGVVVPPFDPEAAARGLIALLDRPKSSWSGRFDRIRESLSWSAVVQPLYRYCLYGGYAPDCLDRSASGPVPDGESDALRRAVAIWRREGFSSLAHRTWRHLQWRLARS